MALRAQDILLLLKLATNRGQGLTLQANVARAIGISPSEASNALRRAASAGLYVPSSMRNKKQGRIGSIQPTALCEFVIHGLRYIFPASLGDVAIGMPTAWGAAPLMSQVVAGRDGIPVWPSAQGTRRGLAVKPLYPSVLDAAVQDAELYQTLALIDAIRVGRPREREIAIRLLRQKLLRTE